MNNRSPLLDRLRKVRALARHGEAGERSAAAEALSRLLTDHGLTEADLDPPEDAVAWRRFSYATVEEKAILTQVICATLKASSFMMASCRGRRGFEVELTASQAADIEIRYALCVRQWRIERDRLLRAFILRHGLTSGQPPAADTPPPDIDEVMAIRAFIGAMSPIALYPALTKPPERK